MFRSVESNVLKAAVQSGATSTARVKENIKTAIDSSAHPQLGVIRKSKALSNAMDREKRKSNGTTGRVPTEPQDIIDSLPERLKKTSAGAPFLIHNGYIDDDGTLLMMVFMSEHGEFVMSKSTELYGDGIFDTCPQPFSQIFVILGRIGDKRPVPVVFGLLP